MRLLRDGQPVAETHERQLRRLQIRQARREFRRLSSSRSRPGPAEEDRRDQARRQHQSRRDQAVSSSLVRHRRRHDAACDSFVRGNDAASCDRHSPSSSPPSAHLPASRPGRRRPCARWSGSGSSRTGCATPSGSSRPPACARTISPSWRQQLDRDGYRPGKLWAPAISLTQFVGGPLLALGLFTRPAAFAILMFLVVVTNCRALAGRKILLEPARPRIHADVDGGRLYFLVHGGGVISLDHLLVGREF